PARAVFAVGKRIGHAITEVLEFRIPDPVVADVEVLEQDSGCHGPQKVAANPLGLGVANAGVTGADPDSVRREVAEDLALVAVGSREVLAGVRCLGQHVGSSRGSSTVPGEASVPTVPDAVDRDHGPAGGTGPQDARGGRVGAQDGDVLLANVVVG